MASGLPFSMCISPPSTTMHLPISIILARPPTDECSQAMLNEEMDELIERLLAVDGLKSEHQGLISIYSSSLLHILIVSVLKGAV
ncbi:hypothetical protein Aduo_015075 [Ancylostoma duodenale]